MANSMGDLSEGFEAWQPHFILKKGSNDCLYDPVTIFKGSDFLEVLDICLMSNQSIN